MVDDPARPGKKAASYWEPAKRMLNDPTKFLDSLLNFDKDNIRDFTIVKIEPYIGMEEFTPEAVARVGSCSQLNHFTLLAPSPAQSYTALLCRGNCW